MNQKQMLYCQNRAAGLKPKEAGIQAGYSTAGIDVTVSRLEQREDVRKQTAAYKRAKGKATAPTEQPEALPNPDALEPWKLRDHYPNPLALLTDVMNNKLAPKGLRIQCAKDAMPYCHAKKEGTKKDEAAERANQAGKGKFGMASAPSNVVQLRRGA